MKKLLLCLSAAFGFVHLSAQCPVTTIPSGDNGNGVCYIDAVAVDANVINTGTGFSAPTPSYQSFSSPYIMLKQGQLSSFTIDFTNGTTATLCAWIDYDQDGMYSSTEIAFYEPGLSGPNMVCNTVPPITVAPDTFRMRITLQQGVPGWGPGTNDACLAPGYGEVEDYLVILQCADPMPLSFDQWPVMCWQDSVSLFATGMYDVAWFAGTPSTMIGTGFNFYFHPNPNCTDTLVYLASATEGCYSNPQEVMSIVFDPSPIANIIGPDTIRSCSTVTINATPGPYTYLWNAGGTDSSITFTSGFGGNLTLLTMYPSGCYATDQIYVNIATAPPATYTHVVPGSNFCTALELSLVYDSIIAPGTCSWYSYPANTFIGTGSYVSYTPPDTGVYQFMAIVNSVCGIDTMIHTYNAYNFATYDSLYMLNATQDVNGTYVFCFGNTGMQHVVLAGLSGVVTNWLITDTTNGMSMTWNDDYTLDLPSNLATPGHVYTAVAIITTAQGCSDSSEIIVVRPENTLNFNLSDTSWMCSFPAVCGISSASYAQYDFLWSNGDTTNYILVPSPANVTLHVTDNITGCITNDTSYIADASQQQNLFGDTIFSCDNFVYIDPGFVQYSTNSWTEYDLNWSQINASNNFDITVFNTIGDEYLVFEGYNSHGCYIFDTTLITFNGTFTFSLGPDITTSVTPVTLSGPNGYGVYTYTWMPGNVYSQNLQVTTSGTYTLIIDNGYNCMYADDIVVNILPMGIQSASVANVNVYPNPANDVLNVQADEIITHVNIYDMNGRIIATQNVNASSAVIDVASFDNGSYLLESVTETGIIRSRFFIVE